MADKAIMMPAHPRDAIELAELMRDVDREELRAQTMMGPLAVLLNGIEDSYLPGTARGADGKLWCVFGVVPYGSHLTDTGLLWLLGTDELTRHAVGLTVHARAYIEFVRQRFPRLMNYVDARNTPSIRWLRYMGFELDQTEPYGVERRPFHRFHLGF